MRFDAPVHKIVFAVGEQHSDHAILSWQWLRTHLLKQKNDELVLLKARMPTAHGRGWTCAARQRGGACRPAASWFAARRRWLVVQLVYAPNASWSIL